MTIWEAVEGEEVATCTNDRGETHLAYEPASDADLQKVLAWFAHRDARALIGNAVEDAIYYVLDGARTHRFDVMDERVDSDERRTIGTKLQFHVMENFELPRLRHPDTMVDGVGVEIKGTIGGNWAIPREGQCGVTLMIQADVERDRQQAYLMRTHRCWLREGANHDGKRGVVARSLAAHAVLLYPWAPLRPNPLKRLSDPDREAVFDLADGQQVRLKRLFLALPHTEISRAAILTVCAGNEDPMRRVRAIRPQMRALGYELLCGKWEAQRELGSRLGFDLTGAAWVAIRVSEVDADYELGRRVREEIGLPDDAHPGQRD